MKKLNNKKQIKKFNNDYISINEIANNISEFLNLDYDLDLVKRIENNEPITKVEYLYYEYSLPIKLICLRQLKNNIRRGNNV